ncbi:helix-turn-helix domain-containing protein [Paenibacillus sp. 32352]|uniref:helix-turn-helix domain-containing protein n=1 Tax=Paenibacillus sp. 32352 TaxID=1969111 RepID=UPI002118B0AD|nr:helix-turn-helix domain-containing protein [Paenibacillus sp. 32352]
MNVNIRSFVKNRKLYTVFLMSITLCIAVTLMISSYVYYRNYTGIALEQAYQSDVNSLTGKSKEVIGMTDSAQALSFQIYRNSTIGKLLYYPVPNIYDVTAAMVEISNYLNSMLFIESILVYNSASDTFYVAAHSGQNGIFTRSELADTGILDILSHFNEYKPFTPIPRSYDISSDTKETISAYTYLCYDAINKNQTINSAVVVNISASWINKDIAPDHESTPGQAYILDDKNRMLSITTLLPPRWSEADNALILNHVAGSKSGYFIDKINGEKALVTFTEKDSLGWQYVRITPYRTLTNSIGTIRNTTMAIASVILLAGFIISWLLSGILYRPIRRMMHKVHSLETERRDHFQTIKQNALRRLLLGTRSFSSELKPESLKSIGITFQFHQDYRVVILRIDRFQKLKASNGKDLPLYKYAMMNISSEIMSSPYQAETVDMDDDSITMLVNLSEEQTSVSEKGFVERLQQIQKAIHDFLSISVSIAYSPVTNQPHHLHPLYEQVKEAALHRMFYGHGCLIDSEDIVALKSREYIYPVEKGKRLSDAIMAGKMEEAKALFDDIVQETSHYPIHVMRLAISHLSMTINNLIYTIQKNGALEFRSGLDIYMPSVETVETVEELTSSFHAFLDEIQSKLVEKRTMKQGDLIRSINELIDWHYADPNLCLNWIAEQVSMSSIYVSRVYKQQTLNAIVDVINEVRLKKAKEHLEQSDSSIAEIAEKTGYTSSSYFHRMFKKRFGVTPAEYRKAVNVRMG